MINYAKRGKSAAELAEIEIMYELTVKLKRIEEFLTRPDVREAARRSRVEVAFSKTRGRAHRGQLAALGIIV